MNANDVRTVVGGETGATGLNTTHISGAIGGSGYTREATTTKPDVVVLLTPPPPFCIALSPQLT